jgi:hypothetical protein
MALIVVIQKEHHTLQSPTQRQWGVIAPLLSSSKEAAFEKVLLSLQN